MKTHHAIAACLLHLSPVSMGEEILIHSGPVISTPALEIFSPHAPRNGTGKTDRFIKEFYLELGKARSQPERVAPSEILAIDAGKAAELAAWTVFRGDGARVEVTGVERRSATISGGHEVDYFFVSLIANGSSEHRVVLMDATVMRPRLRRVFETTNRSAAGN